MLNSLAIGLALYLVTYIALEALVIKGVVDSDDVQSYLSCALTNTTLANPVLLCGVVLESGSISSCMVLEMTIIIVILYELDHCPVT